MNDRIAYRLFKTVLSASVLAMFFAGPVHAASGPEYGAAGGYVGVGLGLGYENFDTNLSITDPTAGYGFDAWGGYRFNRWFSAELQLEYLNGFNFRAVPLGTPSLQGEAVTLTGNVKFYPFDWQIQPYVHAGVGMGYVKFKTDGGYQDDGVGLAARFGGGVDFWLTETIALTANASYILEREQDLSLIENPDYISVVIGAQVRF